MKIECAGYKGKKLWSVSLDGMEPVIVRAPDDAAALIRAAVYYGIDWLRASNRMRFKVWRFSNNA